MDSKTERIKLNISAIQKPETLKPSIRLSANKIINALITNKNKPNVRMVTGNVKMMSSGFMVTLNKAKTTATITELVKFSTETPGKKWAITKTATAVNTIFKMKFMGLCF